MQRLLTLVPLIFAVGAGFVPASASTVGFGKVTASSAPGHPLDFAVGVVGDEAIEARCVNAVVVSGDKVLPADQVSAAIEHLGSSGRQVRVVTHQALEDRPAQIILRIGCPPHLSRSFTVYASSASAPVTLANSGAPGGSAALDRMLALEATVSQLRGELRRRDESLEELRSRIREAEAARDDKSIVYGLLGLCGLLLIGVLGLVWSGQVQNRRTGWWATAASEVMEETSTPSDTTPSAADIRPSTMKSMPGAFGGAGTGKADVMSGLPPRQFPVSQPVSAAPPRDVPARAPDLGLEQGPGWRSMASEELIDLEQQADFFVVLGQDDAAIDLLMGHVRSTGGVSPLPYLKLLEIYRRRNEQEPYERIRERFNRRFNGYVPGWAVDLEAGGSLEDNPEVLTRLQNAWAMPSRSMDLLEEMLFRRDAGPTFDVPAYRELLFLYGIARDLAERDVPEAGVDLLLPFGEEEIVTHSQASLSTTGVPLVDAPLSLDLDVSTDQPPSLAVEDRSRAGLDRRPDRTVEDKNTPKGSH